MAIRETGSDERWLAERLARAERAVGERALADATRRRAGALVAALALAVVGLLLPWSRDNGTVRDAFSYSAALVVLTLLTAAGGAVALAAYAAAPGRRRGIAVRAVVIPGGVLSMIAGLAVNGHVDAEYRQWWGPGLLEAALVAAIGLAAMVIDVENPSRARLVPADHAKTESLDGLRAGLLSTVRSHGTRPARALPTVLTALGIAGLGVAAVGLTSSWQRLSGAVVTHLADHPLVWRGTELADTHALRWAIAAGLAATLATAAARPVRWLLPLELVAAGAVVIAETVDVTGDIPVRGTASAISVDAGAWLTLAGGAVAAACGLALGLLSWRTERRRTGVAAVALAVLAGGFVIAPQHRAGADTAFGAPILGALDDTDGRLGAPAARAEYETYDTSGLSSSRVDSPIVARSLDGTSGTWFLRALDRDDYLIEEIVDGRALPVTEVYGARSVDLLGVDDGRAVLAGDTGLESFVTVVDLHDPSSQLGGRLDPDGELPATVLTTGYGDEQRQPGVVVAKDLEVQLIADGSAVVTARPEDSARNDAYLVDAATVRGTKPWTLTNRLPSPNTRMPLYGLGGTAYTQTPFYTAPGVQGLAGDGHTFPVAGGVSDKRCALSRDPLRSSLSGYGAQAEPGSAAMDRAGNLWLVLAEPDKQSGLYIVGADGVLRRMPPSRQPGGQPVEALRIAGDGSLFVSTRHGKYGRGPTYRIADPAAVAKRAEPLPAVSPGCVSDNRVTVTTAGHPAVHRATISLPEADTSYSQQLITAGATGTALRSWWSDERWTLRRSVDGHHERVIYTTAARIDDLEPDGRGGAWWLEIEPDKTNEDVDGPGSIGHVDAAGHARIVARRVVPAATVPDDRADLAADPHDGSLWWGVGEAAWLRTTVDGRTTHLRYRGAAPTLGGGTGYIDADAVYRMTGTGPGAAVIGADSGRRLLLPSAIASHAALTDFAAEGTVNTMSDGRLLLHQGGYLARFSGGQVEVLSGPADGLPREDDVRSSFVQGGQLVLTTYTGQVFTVDVS